MKRPVRPGAVEACTWYAGTDRELVSRALSDVGGDARIGVGLLELQPGCHTRPAHWHALEEEHLYVLSGEGELHLGDETHRLEAGDYVCFPAGQAVLHHLSNSGHEAFRYLMIGERIAEDRVTHERDFTAADDPT
ncbi:MAG TPA: cupin domain-containing protein [Pseudomonadales bacterium]|nr:cupin domain-containing protein [Pseudomonadales bacterium]